MCYLIVASLLYCAHGLHVVPPSGDKYRSPIGNRTVKRLSDGDRSTLKRDGVYCSRITILSRLAHKRPVPFIAFGEESSTGVPVHDDDIISAMIAHDDPAHSAVIGAGAGDVGSTEELSLRVSAPLLQSSVRRTDCQDSMLLIRHGEFSYVHGIKFIASQCLILLCFRMLDSSPLKSRVSVVE